jgi:hypothetical protein
VIGFLVYLIIAVIIAGLLYWCLQQLPLPAPFKQVALVLLVCVFIIYLLWIASAVVPMPGFHRLN